MPINHLIWNFLCLFSENIIFSIAISKICSIKLDMWKFVIFSLLSSIFLTSFMYIFVDITTIFFTSILNMMIIILGNLYIFKLNLINSLINVFIWSINISSINAFSYLINLSLNPNSYKVPFIIIFAIVTSLGYKIVSTGCLNETIIKIKMYLNNSNYTSIFALTFLLFCNFLNIVNNTTLFIIIIMKFIMLFGYSYIISKKTKIDIMKIKLNTLTLQILSMQNLIDRVRTIKHDYNNTLCSIGGYISLNDISGLKEFYSRLNLDMTLTNNIQLINTTSINDPSIYNLFCLKHNKIMKNNIKFNFYSSVNYKDLDMPSYELSKILGILLDNAIEAAILSEEREIFLNCDYKRNNFYKFTIKNSYANKDVDVNKIYLKGFSSKKEKSGIGLWEVSSIINNFPNVSISTKKDATYFTQTLKIPAKGCYYSKP